MQEAVEYYGTEFGRHPVGTGPFKYQYWKEGVKLVFRKNTNYFEFEKTPRHQVFLSIILKLGVLKSWSLGDFQNGRSSPSYPGSGICGKGGLLNEGCGALIAG